MQDGPPGRAAAGLASTWARFFSLLLALLALEPGTARRCRVLAAALALAGAVGTPGAQPVPGSDALRPALRIGVLAYLGSEVAVEEWAPVARQLASALPGYRIELRYLDHQALDRAARAQALDFVITNPGHYTELESRLGAARMLTLQTGPVAVGSAYQAVGAAVVTRAERTDIQRLSDLRGLRVAIVGQEAFAGYQAPWRELVGAGIAHDLRALQVVGLPMDRVLAAVASGEADAGFVRACMIESRPDWQARFRVVAPLPAPGFPCQASTRLYPNWPIATLRHTPAPLAKAVAIALLEMAPASSPISWTVPADYQAVHALMRELQMGPYESLRNPSLRALAERYWGWVAALALLLAAWVFYTVRVEQQVQARTAALREALDARDALQARLRHSQEQADHMARLSVLGEMSGTLAHELNQPLAAIGNYAQSLTRRTDNQRLTVEAVREAASEIAGQAQRAADILGRIRSFAKKRPAQRVQVSPSQLVADTVALFHGMLAPASAVEVLDALAPHYRIKIDGLQIQQILLNLLKNAYDATRHLPPERQRLTVRLDHDHGALRIELRDRGEALPSDVSERLFEPFYSTKADGMGLGLAICRSIAEAHGGRLQAHAASDGPGLVLCLTLPDHDRP